MAQAPLGGLWEHEWERLWRMVSEHTCPDAYLVHCPYCRTFRRWDRWRERERAEQAARLRARRR